MAGDRQPVHTLQADSLTGQGPVGELCNPRPQQGQAGSQPDLRTEGRPGCSRPLWVPWPQPVLHSPQSQAWPLSMQRDSPALGHALGDVVRPEAARQEQTCLSFSTQDRWAEQGGVSAALCQAPGAH